MIQISPSAYTIPEMYQGGVLEDDDKWMPVGNIGHSRPLMYDTKNGGWISLLRARGAGTIQRHRHASPVTAWTLGGSWGYREHDWVAKAGSFVYEPAGHIHTLFIHPDEGHMLAVFHIYGPLVYINDAGEAEDYEDVFVRIDRYAAYCKSAGISEDWIRSLIR